MILRKVAFMFVNVDVYVICTVLITDGTDFIFFWLKSVSKYTTHLIISILVPEDGGF